MPRHVSIAALKYSRPWMMLDLNIVFINWLEKNAKTCLLSSTEVQVGPE